MPQEVTRRRFVFQTLGVIGGTLAQAQVPDGFSVTVPVYAGDLFDEEATVLIKESLAQLGLELTRQKMPIGQKRSLLVKKQVDMAIYDFRPWVPDIGYFIYWTWLLDSLNNYWSYVNPEAQALGNKAMTIRLRPGVLFHNGREVDAAAVQWNLARMQDPHVGHPLTRSALANLRKTVVLDKYTVQCRLHTPSAAFLADMAYYPCNLIAPDSAEQAHMHPIGCGPFKLARWERYSVTELVRFEHYFETDAAGNSLPYLVGVSRVAGIFVLMLCSP